MKIKEIGIDIKKRRNFLRITQHDLAEITGISRRSLQYIEKGQMNPSIEQLEKILDAIGLEIVIRVKSNE
jgi:transcriptional regulator with XRE-family HTH domain